LFSKTTGSPVRAAPIIGWLLHKHTGRDGKPLREADGMPMMTGGHEIHIIIHPPKEKRADQKLTTRSAELQ
jgi:hypothetical protein